MASFIRRGIAVLRSRQEVRRQHRQLVPPLRSVDFGDLRRTEPISNVFGLDRGTPVDCYFIEGFLARNSELISGRVLEIADATYTKRFGGRRVTQSDILHLTGEGGRATIIADLTHAPEIADGSFDCIILTQTLQFTFRMQDMVSEIHRILTPGGCVLCTVPGISQISRYDMERWGDYWRLTTLSARELFETSFEPGMVEVTAHGNVLAATAFLYGLAAAELTREELDAQDDDYQLIVAIKAMKAPRA